MIALLEVILVLFALLLLMCGVGFATTERVKVGCLFIFFGVAILGVVMMNHL